MVKDTSKLYCLSIKSPHPRSGPLFDLGWSATNLFANLSFFCEPTLYVRVNNFSVMSEHFLDSTSTKQRIKSYAQGHNTVPLMGLGPVILPSQLSILPLSHRTPYNIRMIYLFVYWVTLHAFMCCLQLLCFFFSTFIMYIISAK